ncbi:hypothetical protein C0989_012016 [Termitomyces sp. Mn162]|nr:hypothetical protein C0989_012016 [Termitomyces sp. Mn162]
MSDPIVFFQHFGVDEDVVKIDADYALCDEVLEDVIHHGLEGGRAVGESKEHHDQFEQFLVGLEGGLPLVSFLNVHVVVTPLDVQFSKVLCTLEVVDVLRDEREGIAVLYCHGIENPIILD